MLRRIIELLLTCLIFYLYFKILGFIFNSFVPFTPNYRFHCSRFNHSPFSFVHSNGIWNGKSTSKK